MGPAGCFASLEAIPTFGWLQIMAFTCAAETGFSATPWAITKQEDDKAPGDIGGSSWVRYDDEGEKAYKLNVERQNGRGAMLGITGCLIHELLGVDALYPTASSMARRRSRSSTASTPSRPSPRSLRREPGS